MFLAGCGGGFDFVHGMLLYPTLRALGKEVIVGSYSFGDPSEIGGDTPVVFERGDVQVRRVTSVSIPSAHYASEVHTCRFLDLQYPETAPHFLYAYYARDFSVPLLTALYAQFVEFHDVDAVVVVDGGSDSLMRGDEEGLGDPIEDCVSVTTVAGLASPGVRVLVTVGLGGDRRNHVSDASALRAIAELTRMGGFLGAVAFEPSSREFRFFRSLVDCLFEHQPFQSVIAGAIAAASEGHFGASPVPVMLEKRVRAGDLFLWPLMGIVWGFDAEVVAKRSLISDWIRDATTVRECNLALYEGRREIARELRSIEELPRHTQFRGSVNHLEPDGGT